VSTGALASPVAAARPAGPWLGTASALRGVLVFAVLSALFPLAFTDSYHLRLATEVLINALLATSLNLLVGYGGMVSLGHAAFFGVGAYTSGLLLLRAEQPVLVSIAAGMAVAAVLAWVIGTFCVRTAEVYFAMLTLAFGQLLFVVAYYWVGLTRGDDGLVGIPSGRLAVPGVFRLDLGDPLVFYFFALAVVVAGIAVCRIVIGSSFGTSLRGIRENRQRIAFLGGDVARLRLRVFVLAGAMAGLAGGLYAPFQGFVSPEILYWTRSGEVLLATVLGGMFSFWGPPVGVGLMLALKDTLLAYTERWKLVLGLALLLIVLFLPGGLIGYLEDRIARVRQRRNRAQH
jgi:branched-chain amino acid transport system permease protein